jgi:restriction system protein
MDGNTGRHYWGISLGEGGKYVSEAKRGDFVAIGWNELGDLKRWRELRRQDGNRLSQQFRAFYRQRFPSDTAIQSGIGAAQVWNFVVVMKPGDIVLMRDPPRRKVHIAEVAGAYEFVEAPHDGCEYRHRREVRWVGREIDREDLPEGLDSSLRSLLTIFNLDKWRDAIEEQMGTVVGERLVEVVLNRIQGLSAPQFEQFVGHILTLAGFSASVTRPVGDKGVDVVGTLGAAGLAEITLNVQVKKIRTNVGIEHILQLRGTLGQDEHGAFVTLGGFTRQAVTEAQAPGKKGIMLVDGQSLVDMVLQHYEQLSQEYKDLLKLRKREVPLRDQFVTLA